MVSPPLRSRTAIVFLLLFITCSRFFETVVEEPLRIMFLGDSITQGAGSAQTTYITHLYDSLTARGVSFESVGSMAQWDIVHEGHYGWRADSVLQMLPAWTKDKKLDVVLCHLGTNDLAHEHDVSRGSVINRTIDDLEAIIDTIRRGNPGVSMYIAQIIPPACLVQRELFRAFNGNVAEIGPRKSRPSSPVYIVDHFTDFSVITDLKDGVHPSEAGAVKMATRWLRAMEEAGELGR